MSTAPISVPVDQRSLSIDEFCAIELRGSRATYYKLRSKGLGPEVLTIPGTKIKRVTVEARAAWHARMKKLSASKEVRAQEQRLQEQTKEAAKASIKSAKHVSKKHAKRRRKGGAS